MSATARKKAPNAEDIRARKGGEPLVSLTAYTTPMARLMDAHCDFVLVGDSVGMVLHGLDSTLGVTMEMMILHGQAVARGLDRAMMVVDMPFGSYEHSPAEAFRNAARLMAETGAAAVKLEGGVEMADTIRFLVKRGIPVMAHIGLTPQSINTLGGYKVQGRDEQAERSAGGRPRRHRCRCVFGRVREGSAGACRPDHRRGVYSHHWYRRLGRVRRADTGRR